MCGLERSMQMLLTSPDITCGHCLATIRDVLAPIDGARFLFGDPDRRTFAVDLNAGRSLDEVSAPLESAGYPLGAALAQQPPESCCCGNWILVGLDTEPGHGATLPAREGYRIEVRTVTMPWAQAVDVTLAIPRTA
jgi:copper chaperone CopZ